MTLGTRFSSPLFSSVAHSVANDSVSEVPRCAAKRWCRHREQRAQVDSALGATVGADMGMDMCLFIGVYVYVYMCMCVCEYVYVCM